MQVSLFDTERPTRKAARREIGAMPGDTVQPDLFGGETVIARKHRPIDRPTPAAAVPALFAVDAGQFDGQATTVDAFTAAK